MQHQQNGVKQVDAKDVNNRMSYRELFNPPSVTDRQHFQMSNGADGSGRGESRRFVFDELAGASGRGEAGEAVDDEL